MEAGQHCVSRALYRYFPLPDSHITARPADRAELGIHQGPVVTGQWRCRDPCGVCLFGDKCLALSIRSNAWQATLGQLAGLVLLRSHRRCRKWITDKCKENKLNLQELFARQ